ncbi:MAG: EAL domain-containing protein [Lachnospiraceae bacterium]|nr:EAL domain-containing protein [Lachnospiraceae bacterium]
MSKKVFAIFTDKATASEDGELLSRIAENIESLGHELRVIPPVESLSEAEAVEALKAFKADALIFAGSHKGLSKKELGQANISELTEDEKAELETVRKILDENLLTYHFQPIISAVTGQIFAYEALMRPKIDENNMNPGKILKYAEMMGRLGDVEKATFLNVTGIIDEKQAEIGDKLIFINSIPGVRLLPDDYLDIESALVDHAGNVVVEITEQTEADEVTLRAIKRRYEQLGIGLALDDYGTGYSNVINLLQYMPAYVKIDRSLLSEIDKYPKKQRFVKEIIEFCQDNNIISLAEGVETWRELRMVVRMGVDLIQGFYTAMPGPVLISEIDSDIKREILRYQDEYKAGKKQPVFIADDTGRVNLSSLAKSSYSCILIGKDERESKDVTVSGIQGLKSNAHIEIAANYVGRLTLENAYLTGMQGKACIELGDNCDVTLCLIGDNHLEKGGIKVPDTSMLRIEGGGNLSIFLDAQNCYGIGNDLSSTNGHIAFNQDGVIDIDVKGNSGVCIGSGYGGPININRGKYNLAVNCGFGVGVGCFYNEQKVRMSDCEFEINIAVTKGVGIGSLEGNTEVSATNASIRSNAEGTEITVCGTVEGAEGKIHYYDAGIYTELRGDYITALGSLKGRTDYLQERATLRVSGSGSHALAFGGFGEGSVIKILDSDTSVDIMTACQKDTMAEPENVIIRHGKNKFMVNGYPYEHYVDYGEYKS